MLAKKPKEQNDAKVKMANGYLKAETNWTVAKTYKLSKTTKASVLRQIKKKKRPMFQTVEDTLMYIKG